jgi:hypothetical protein
MKLFKQITLFFAVLVLFTNCSKDETAATPAIVGKWKVTTVTGKLALLGQTTDVNENLAASNLVYDFKSDGTYTSTGSLDVVDVKATNTQTSGTYKISGNTVTIAYKNSKNKDVTEIYPFTVSGTSMAFKINLDEYKRQLTATGDPNASVALAFITSVDLSINFIKQ